MDYKRVASTYCDNVWVSTVWLGLDHRYGKGLPLIFEAMIFPSQPHERLMELTGERRNYSEIDAARYSTESEALAGHQRFVEQYQHWRPDE